MKYYNLTEILKKNADYNLIVGERSNGKTYACLKYAIEQYIKDGSQSAYIRRWKEDIIGKRAESVFNAVVENDVVSKATKGEYSSIIYSRGKYYLSKYNEEKKKFTADKTPFCYGFSLSDVEHDKSTSYPTIKIIIFDEFITRQTYLRDEFVIFMNVLSTIIRQKSDVKIFMLGNTVNKYSPYFDEMGLKNVSTMEQGLIDLYKYGDTGLTVAVEYCASNSKSKKSNKYFAFDNSKLNMITNGSWEIDLYPHLQAGQKIKNKDVTFSFFVIFNGSTIQGDIVQNEDGMFLFFHNKTGEIKDYDNQLIYTMDTTTKPNIKRELINSSSKLTQKITYFFAVNKVFYQSNNIGEIINNYIKQSSKR